MLNVAGNYTGTGGTLVFNSVLGGDVSKTDRLQVGGDTSGSSHVKVVNRGGNGAQTTDGIKIIDIAGASNGLFDLLGDFVTGRPSGRGGGCLCLFAVQGRREHPGGWRLVSALRTQEPAPAL
ncbi:autotransporter outer membrane beta-barrel domain-containing protein [Ochrobactrum oryzae]|nr:autotransporter outer membrane beta-barrel domain-containing protein [Brucella oryzae]